MNTVKRFFNRNYTLLYDKALRRTFENTDGKFKICFIITSFNYLAKWSLSWLLIKVGTTARYNYIRVGTGEIFSLLLFLLQILQVVTTCHVSLSNYVILVTWEHSSLREGN